MKVIEEHHFERMAGTGYVFICPRCGSKIEIHEVELTKHDNRSDSFCCPVCRNFCEAWWLNKLIGAIRYFFYKRKTQSGTEIEE